MPITAECPLCATKGQVPSSFSGKRVKCPKCCNMFVVSGPASQSFMGNQKLPGSSPGGKMSGSGAGQGTVKPGSTHHGITKPGGTNHGGIKPGASQAGNQKLAGSGAGNQKKPDQNGFRRMSPPTQEIPAFNPDEVLNRGRVLSNGTNDDFAPKKRGRNPAPIVIGMLALFLGLSAAAICWIPEVAIYGAYLGLAGLAFGGLGFLLGLVVRSGVGLSIFASIVCLAAVACGFLFTDGSSSLGTTPTDTRPDTSPSPETQPEPTRPEPKIEEWIMAPDGVARVGDVRIKVTGVEIDQVKGKDGKPYNPRDQQTIVKLVVENGGADKASYRGAADPNTKRGDGAPRLTDDMGVLYRVVDFGKDKPIPGQLETTPVMAGKPIVDLLVFERTPEKADHLKLELPGVNFGGAGRVKIKIPRAIIVVKGTVPKDPPPDDKTVVQLLADLKNPNPKLRIDAAGALGKLGAKGGQPALDGLIAQLKDGDPTVRAAVVEALGRLGPTAKSALPAILGALKDPIPAVRGEAAEALGGLGAEAKPHLGTLIALFRDPDPGVRKKALEAVRQLEGTK